MVGLSLCYGRKTAYLSCIRTDHLRAPGVSLRTALKICIVPAKLGFVEECRMISDPNDARPLAVGNKGESDLALERETLRESVAHDFTTTESGIVPLDRRRSAVTLGAVWLVLEAGWVYIFTGFALFQAGLNLAETSLDLLLGVAFYFAYSMVAAFIGSRSGQTHSLL